MNTGCNNRVQPDPTFAQTLPLAVQVSFFHNEKGGFFHIEKGGRGPWRVWTIVSTGGWEGGFGLDYWKESTWNQSRLGMLRRVKQAARVSFLRYEITNTNLFAWETAWGKDLTINKLRKRCWSLASNAPFILFTRNPLIISYYILLKQKYCASSLLSVEDPLYS